MPNEGDVCVQVQEGTQYSCTHSLTRGYMDVSDTRYRLRTATRYLYRVIHNDFWGIVYSCTIGSRNSQSFLLWCAVCSCYAFLPELKVRIRTAMETITADMLQTV